MERAFWRHKTSGDVYAVELNDDGTAYNAVGPVYYSDVTELWLSVVDFGASRDADIDAEWLNNQAIRRLEPADYYRFEGIAPYSFIEGR